MSIKRWEKSHDINRFFNDLFDWGLSREEWGPALDLYQEDDKLIAKMSISGLDPDKTEIKVTDDILTIRGSREEKEEKKGKNYYSKEIREGSFERSLRLPVKILADKIDATYKKGILRVSMPINKTSEQKKIQIKYED